ncbi:MAG TPA: hypothetical protein VM204_08685, partial [Gaiellaceae bacterium]|nr:hypothetical protein [Gaiellaceae bacterium]
AAAIDALLPDVPRLWHGEEAATWAVVREAVRRGRDVRIGLEDVLDADNPTLVERVVALAA